MARVSTVVVPKPEFDALVAENAQLHSRIADGETEAQRDDLLAALKGAADDLEAIAPTWHGAGRGQILAVALRIRTAIERYEANLPAKDLWGEWFIPKAEGGA